MNKAKSEASKGSEARNDRLSTHVRSALDNMSPKWLLAFETHGAKLKTEKKPLTWGRTKSEMFAQLCGIFNAPSADDQEAKDAYVVAYSGTPLVSAGRYPPRLLLINEANRAPAFHPTGWHTNITTPVCSSTYTAAKQRNRVELRRRCARHLHNQSSTSADHE